ncbi:hypothetical protein GJ744_011932 [Endocarpon pusillum]|uniref:Heterokaryon incompatibility domain-containing protein n=1 Tax=Endocarpon pusillum TaxID=364733 RepID=A0A8H7E730_9EURO|nr:hypothetical protein GJ744_011932 [Endocarpon pusillum]
MLRLSPHSPSSRIECSMTTFSLVENPPRYVALSYCWGDERITRDITGNGITKPVTINLEEALQQLSRHLDTGVGLWIDALCINQYDKQERSQQIRLMKTIFEKAEACYAWLGGQGGQDNMHGFQSVRALVEAPRDSVLFPASQLLYPACTEFLSICRSPYWQRRWIIQELAVALEVKVLAGSSTLSLRSLQSAFLQCATSSFWLSEHESASAFFQKVIQLRSEYQEGGSLLLSDAIRITCLFLSKDPRDNIFALIGVSSDGAFLVPTPNYAQSVGQVSRDLTCAILHIYADFDIIYSGPRSRVTSIPVPTWVPDWCSPDPSHPIYARADAVAIWPRSLVTLALRANANVLQMEGITMGTVIALTSPLTSKRGIRAEGTTFSSMPTPDHSICKDYYGSTRKFTAALVECIMSPESITGRQNSIEAPLSTGFKHFYLWSLRFKRSRDTQSDSSESVATFLSWLRENGAITFNGNSISQCMQFGYHGKAFYVLFFSPIVFAAAGATLWHCAELSRKRPIAGTPIFNILMMYGLPGLLYIVLG